jgi:hypothetical protein
MNYRKPIASTTWNAIEAIQSSTLKSQHIVRDSLQNQEPVQPATTQAYEADE